MAYFSHHQEETQHQPVFNAPVTDELDDEDGFADDVPMTDEEELALNRRDRWKLAAGVVDFFGVIVGMLVILLLVALIISLVNWVWDDMTQSFTLLQTWM